MICAINLLLLTIFAIFDVLVYERNVKLESEPDSTKNKMVLISIINYN